MSELERMRAIFAATDAEGRRLFDDDAVSYFCGYLVLSLAPALDPATLPRKVLAQIGELTEGMGTDGPSLAAQIRAHYRAHPPDPRLVEGFERLFRELLTERAPGAADSAVAAVIGALPRPSMPVFDAKRPNNTVAGGPLAAHLLKSDKPKEP